MSGEGTGLPPEAGERAAASPIPIEWEGARPGLAPFLIGWGGVKCRHDGIGAGMMALHFRHVPGTPMKPEAAGCGKGSQGSRTIGKERG